MRRWKRSLALLLSCLMLVSMACGCSQGAEPADDKAQDAVESTLNIADKDDFAQSYTGGEVVPYKVAQEGVTSTKDKLVVAIDSDPGSMDLYKAAFGPAIMIGSQCMEALTTYDEKGNMIMYLAESFDYDEDRMGCTVKLREGIKFHNGDELNADHVVWTYQNCATSKSVVMYVNYIDLANVKKVDEYTVYFPFTSPCGTFEYSAANIFIVNMNTYEEESARGEGFTGTGPFKVVGWESGVSIDFERNEDYWRGVPYIKEMQFRIITESSVRMMELENGTVDVYRNAMNNDLMRVANNETSGIKLWRANFAMQSHYIGFNCNHAPFDNALVRKAFSYAVDVESLREVVWGVTADTAKTLMPVSMWYAEELPEDLQHKYDPEMAKKLLAEAGYPDGLTINMTVDANQNRLMLAEMLPSMLKKAGITVNITRMENAAFNDWYKTEAADAEYDIFMKNFGGLLEPSTAMGAITSRNAKVGGSSLFHYAGQPEVEKIDELMASAAAQPDVSERQKIYFELERYWAENCFSVPIADYFDNSLVAENLYGMEYVPNYDFAFAYFK